MGDTVDGREEKGGGAPLPAKRTIAERAVSPVKDSRAPVPLRPVPARPAPPPPGITKHPGVIPKLDPASAVKTEQKAPPVQPPGLSPSTPSPTTKRVVSAPPHKDAGKTKTQSSLRKKLEITIVDARPMSQVGFRSVGPEVTLSAKKPPSMVTQANHDEKPASISDAQTESSQLVIAKPPPPESLGSAADADGDRTGSHAPPPLPKRSPIVKVPGPSSDSTDPQPPPKPARAPDAVCKPQETKCLEAVETPDKTVHPARPTRVSIIRPAPRRSSPSPKVEYSISETFPDSKNTDRDQPVPKAQPQASHGPPRPRPPAPASRPVTAPPPTPEGLMSLSETTGEDGPASVSSPPPVPATRPLGLSSSIKHKLTAEVLDSHTSSSQAVGMTTPETTSKPQSSTSSAASAGLVLSPPKPPHSCPNVPQPPTVPTRPPEKLHTLSDRSDTSAQTPPPIPASRNFPHQPPNRPLPSFPLGSEDADRGMNQGHLYESVESNQDEAAKINKTGFSLVASEKPKDPQEPVSEVRVDEQNIEELYAKVNKPGKLKRPDSLKEKSYSDHDSAHPFGVKLKKSVPEIEVPQDAVADSQERGNLMSQTSRPPIALKPKPSLMPKPQPSSKPPVTSRESVAFLVCENSEDVQTKQQGENSDQFKEPPPKRPTILRPVRPSMNQESEKVLDKADQIESDSVQMREKPGAIYLRPLLDVDDDGNSVQPAVAAPVPSRRPVTVIGFPHHRAQPPDLGVSTESKKVSSPTPKQRRAVSQTLVPDALGNGSCDDRAQSGEVLPTVPGRDAIPAATPRVPPPRPDSKPRNTCSDQHKTSESKFSQQPPPRPGSAPSRGFEQLTNFSSNAAADTSAMSQMLQSPTLAIPSNCNGHEAEEDGLLSSSTAIAGNPSLNVTVPPRRALIASTDPSPTDAACHPPVAPSPSSADGVQDSSVEVGEATSTSRPARPSGPPPRPHFMPAQQPVAEKTFVQAAPKIDTPPRPQPVRPPPVQAGKNTELPPLPKRPGMSHPLYRYMIGEPHALALHDFSATQPDELTFQEGDIIVLLKRIDDQWLKGKVEDKEGIFPESFVRCIHPLHEELPSSAIDDMIEGALDETTDDKPDNLTGPRCRARFDFEGEGHGDLAFEAGDVIQLLAHCGSDWLKGQLGDRTGIFPASFVEVIEDLPRDVEDTAAGSEDRETTALFDFEGEHGELSFQAGDKIHVISKVNDQWFYGACNGQEGSFPASFVDVAPHSLPLHTAPSTASSAEQAASLSFEPAVTQSDHKNLSICIGLYDYESDHEGDLAFRQGDSIQILGHAGEDWLRGRLHGKEGIFPASFVSLQSDPDDHMHAVEPGTGLESHSALVLGRALHDFVGETDKELTFQVGDEISLGAMVSMDSEWQWGEFNGKRGIFPASFVEML